MARTAIHICMVFHFLRILHFPRSFVHRHLFTKSKVNKITIFFEIEIVLPIGSYAKSSILNFYILLSREYFTFVRKSTIANI